MKVLLTLDYEVFFGPRAGSVEKTMLEPTEALRAVAQRSGAKMCFFVDAGFLWRLRVESANSVALQKDYSAIRRQLDTLLIDGHEIQLHVHPHWEDSSWNDGQWHINIDRYKLHDFPQAEIAEILARYHAELANIAGASNVFAFRAGGWVIQPFEKLSDALWNLGIRLDSTVYPGGFEGSSSHAYNFRAAPKLSHWRFGNDPASADPAGRFLEVPIASLKLNPLFYWKLAMAKKIGGRKHRQFGDGSAIPLGKSDLANKLLSPTYSVVSMDGYKASFLNTAYNQYLQQGMEDFVVIGHPKALTPYSISTLQTCLLSMKDAEFVGYSAYRNEIAQAGVRS